ncbi:hypothetical protein HNY73_020501 [Argiope bruennichi]|uniref:Uncharacterized protein n=1 Tax=Argiope bruennichi TaxID=94029 RepID=A0A8T0E9K3_ARGBR|nr:hypothetical protein HNY73_020501 [Argiope bruennichi]
MVTCQRLSCHGPRKALNPMGQEGVLKTKPGQPLGPGQTTQMIPQTWSHNTSKPAHLALHQAVVTGPIRKQASYSPPGGGSTPGTLPGPGGKTSQLNRPNRAQHQGNNRHIRSRVKDYLAHGQGTPLNQWARGVPQKPGSPLGPGKTTQMIPQPWRWINARHSPGPGGKPVQVDPAQTGHNTRCNNRTHRARVNIILHTGQENAPQPMGQGGVPQQPGQPLGPGQTTQNDSKPGSHQYKLARRNLALHQACNGTDTETTQVILHQEVDQDSRHSPRTRRKPSPG